MHSKPSVRSISSLIPRLLFLTFPLIIPAACSSSRPPTESAAVQSNAPWEGRLRSLFDDSIDQSAVGLAGSSASHAGGMLVQRAEQAHFIVRVRAATITTEGAGDSLRYLITLRVVGDPIVGPHPPQNEVQISVGRDNMSFAIVKAKDMQLAGTDFIAFLREFNDQGTSSLHWHLARDGQDVVDAAKKGAVLSEVAED